MSILRCVAVLLDKEQATDLGIDTSFFEDLTASAIDQLFTIIKTATGRTPKIFTGRIIGSMSNAK